MARLLITQFTYSLGVAIIGVGILGVMLPVGHLDWSEAEWRDPSLLHRNTMIIDREVERDASTSLSMTDKDC